MKTELTCIQCLVGNAINAARMMTEDPALREEIVKHSLREIADFNCEQPPTAMARRILEYTSGKTGVMDPYREQKDTSTVLAKKMLNRFMEETNHDFNDFETLVRLAIAGNIIDFGVNCNLNMDYASSVIEEAFRKKIDMDALREAEKAIGRAEKILYLLDNCGEAVFDSLLVRKYKDKITLSVKGKPILNDVTRRELKDSGFDGFPAKIVDTGDCTPGVSLKDSSEEFLQAYRECDLIISKGQGNFETLIGTEKPVIFLFMAKCSIVAEYLKTEKNTFQIVCRNLDRIR